MSITMNEDGGVVRLLEGGARIEYGAPINGTHYHRETPKAVVDALERCRINKLRIRLSYGDEVTGQDWHDEYNVTGCVGRSSGQIKVPLIIANRRSIGGGAILDHCVVRIRLAASPKTVLYQHPTYRCGEFNIGEIDDGKYRYAVWVDGGLRAQFELYIQAQRFVRLFE